MNAASRWIHEPVVRRAAATLATLVAASLPRVARAQTDFYNTSSGRPLRIEDAVPTEFRALELDVTPVRLDLFRGRTRQWSLHPEATLGVFPRTQLQVAVPLTYVDARRESSRGVAGLELSALHALNTETSLPAFALGASVLLPIGGLAGDATLGTVKALVTRTLGWGRLHANAELTAGPSAVASGSATESRASPEESRWMAGIAVDHAFVLHSLLLTAESFAEQPMVQGASVAWNAGAGIRYQLAPRWAMDAAVARRFTGNDRAWSITFGTAYVLGIR